MTLKPQAGDVICHEPGTGTWHRKDGVFNDITTDTDVDTSETDYFVVRGKHKPNIYSAEEKWECIVTDDDESTGTMRRGTVSAWAV